MGVRGAAEGFRDGLGRVHDDLRISITDRCNLRCAYCMPEEPVWFPHREILSYEEIHRLARVAVGRGVRKLRLTGGEPLLRRDLTRLLRMLSAEPGVEDLSLTTNGLLLGAMASRLAEAGLRRVNVSLDTLRAERFRAMTRVDLLDRALGGIAAAIEAGLGPVKVNTVLLRGINDDEVVALVGQAREQGWELRFIEFMPVENGGGWDLSRVVTGDETRRRIHRRWPIEPDPEGDPRAPAARYVFRDGKGAVGFVDSVTRPFCEDCSRLRLTADGKFRLCLYDDREIDLKGPMRSGASDRDLDRLMAEAVSRKGRGGALEILERHEARPLDRTMHQIGG
jgi:cyclic pyranopterin phosphate synthase